MYILRPNPTGYHVHGNIPERDTLLSWFNGWFIPMPINQRKKFVSRKKCSDTGRWSRGWRAAECFLSGVSPRKAYRGGVLHDVHRRWSSTWLSTRGRGQGSTIGTGLRLRPAGCNTRRWLSPRPRPGLPCLSSLFKNRVRTCGLGGRGGRGGRRRKGRHDIRC